MHAHPRPPLTNLLTGLTATQFGHGSQQQQQLLLPDCTLTTGGFISDDIAPALTEFYAAHARTITQAPTGAGKTVALARFILPHFAALDSTRPDQRRLSVLLVPTIALADQISKDTACGTPPALTGNADLHDFQAALACGYCVATYDQAHHLSPYIARCWVDEAHYIVSAVSYRKQALDAIQRIRLTGAQIHLVSATPPPLYSLEKFTFMRITAPQPEPVPVELRTFAASKVRTQAAAYLAERYADPDQSTLTVIQLNSAKHLKALKLHLESLGAAPESVQILTAKNKAGALYKSLLNSENVPANVRFILATCVIESGLSIYAPARSVELSFFQNQQTQPTPEQLIQFFARIRRNPDRAPAAVSYVAYVPETETTAPAPTFPTLANNYTNEKAGWETAAAQLDSSAQGRETVHISPVLSPYARNIIDLTPNADQRTFAANEAAIMHQVSAGWQSEFSAKTLASHLQDVWGVPCKITTAPAASEQLKAALADLKKAEQAELEQAKKMLAKAMRTALATTNDLTAVLALPLCFSDTLTLPKSYRTVFDLPKTAPETTQAIAKDLAEQPDLVEWFMLFVYRLAKRGIAPNAIFRLMLTNDGQLHSSAYLAGRAHAIALLYFNEANPDSLTAQSKKDRETMLERISGLQVGKTYTANQIIAIVNKHARTKKQQLGKLQALELVRALFVVTETRTKAAKFYTLTARQTLAQAVESWQTYTVKTTDTPDPPLIQPRPTPTQAQPETPLIQPRPTPTQAQPETPTQALAKQLADQPDPDPFDDDLDFQDWTETEPPF